NRPTPASVAMATRRSATAYSARAAPSVPESSARTAARNFATTPLPFGTARERQPLDAARDADEHGADRGPQEGDRRDADDGDEGQQQAVLGQRGALFLAGEVLGDELLGGGQVVAHQSFSVSKVGRKRVTHRRFSVERQHTSALSIRGCRSCQ